MVTQGSPMGYLWVYSADPWVTHGPPMSHPWAIHGSLMRLGWVYSARLGVVHWEPAHGSSCWSKGRPWSPMDPYVAHV